MTYTLTLGSVATIHSGDTLLYVLESPSLTIADVLDGRSTMNFTLQDDAGVYHFLPTTPVTFVDSVAGLLFFGYINDCVEGNDFPNAANTHTITCMDAHYLADKRVGRREYLNSFAGDIVVDLLAHYLSYEGVTTAFAQDTDTAASDFATGVLSNVVPTTNTADGDLELAPAGTPLTITERTTADWQNNASLTGLDTTGGLLRLASHATMKLQGTAGLNFGNAFLYQQFASASYTIAAGDVLCYTVWVASTSPQIMTAVDFICSDGTTMRDFASTSLTDQNGLLAHPKQDLSGFANDQWYARVIAIGAMSGKQINVFTAVLEGDTQGTYTGYIRDVGIFASSGGLPTTSKHDVYSSSGANSTGLALPQNTRIATNGYSNGSLTAVVGYESTGTRIANPTSLTPVGIYQNSLLTYQQSVYPLPVGTAVGVTSIDPLPAGVALAISSSVDGGATFQAATNFGPVPTLLPGAALAAHTIQTMQTLSLTGTDPTATPVLTGLTTTVLPAYQTTKHDVMKVYATQADYNGGTKNLVTVLSNGDVTITNGQRSWLGGSLASQTVFGNGASPAHSVKNGMLAVTCVTGSQAFSRFDFAGSWGTADFTASIDIKVDTAGQWSGFSYMSTGLSNTLNSFAYRVDCNLTSINLARGGNGSSSITTLGGSPVALSLTAGDLHTLTVAYTASSHTHRVSLDGTVYITVVDATYTAAGTFAASYNNSSGATNSGYFQNFGVVPSSAIVGAAGSIPSWTSPTLTLGTMTVESSVVVWNSSLPGNAQIVVNARINGGTYFPCTSGATIPGLGAGVSLTAATVQFQVLLQTGTPATVPLLQGLSCWILSAYSATGYRISPALSIASVGRIGSAWVNWNGTASGSASIAVSTSTDPRAATFTQIGTGGIGAAAVAGISGQPDPVDDSFSTNTASFYIQTNQTGGTPASWTWDTPVSRIEASGGATAFLLNSAITTDDVELTVDMDTSDAGGLVWRVQDTSNFYDCVVADSGSVSPLVAIIYKVVNNTRTTVATYSSLAWTRGRIHRFKLAMVGPLITLSFDGLSILTYTDPHPLGAGRCGLRTNTYGGQSTAYFYNLRIAALGDSALGQVVFIKTQLSTTDPTNGPILTDITTSVRSPDIFTGAFMPTTTYSIYNGSQNTVAHDLDDMARQSNGWWRINRDPTTTLLRLRFQGHSGVLSPWVLSSTDLHVSWPLSFKRDASAYRTTPIIQGGTDVVLSTTETFRADGIRTTYTVDYPIDSIVSITAGEGSPVVYTFGVKGVDSGRDFYYTVGSNVISQDASESPLAAGEVFTPDYYGQINVVAEASSAVQIAAQAALDQTSGIIEVVETAAGLSSAAAQQLAGSRLTKDGVWAETLTCTTPRVGLAVGHFVPVYLNCFDLTDWQGLVVGMTTTYRNDNSRGVMDAVPYFSLTAVRGPILNEWSTTLSGQGR